MIICVHGVANYVSFKDGRRYDVSCAKCTNKAEILDGENMSNAEQALRIAYSRSKIEEPTRIAAHALAMLQAISEKDCQCQSFGDGCPPCMAVAFLQRGGSLMDSWPEGWE